MAGPNSSDSTQGHWLNLNVSDACVIVLEWPYLQMRCVQQSLSH